jgi:hypothetical protein
MKMRLTKKADIIVLGVRTVNREGFFSDVLPVFCVIGAHESRCKKIISTLTLPFIDVFLPLL